MEELRQQAEEQRKKKKMQNFMSEEEYRLNMNQLNVIFWLILENSKRLIRLQRVCRQIDGDNRRQQESQVS